MPSYKLSKELYKTLVERCGDPMFVMFLSRIEHKNMEHPSRRELRVLKALSRDPEIERTRRKLIKEVYQRIINEKGLPPQWESLP
jgi:hypothetical protein